MPFVHILLSLQFAEHRIVNVSTFSGHPNNWAQTMLSDSSSKCVRLCHGNQNSFNLNRKYVNYIAILTVSVKYAGLATSSPWNIRCATAQSFGHKAILTIALRRRVCNTMRRPFLGCIFAQTFVTCHFIYVVPKWDSQRFVSLMHYDLRRWWQKVDQLCGKMFEKCNRSSDFTIVEIQHDRNTLRDDMRWWRAVDFFLFLSMLCIGFGGRLNIQKLK